MRDDTALRDARSVLAINAGSSSLKFALYDMRPLRSLRGSIERIGAPDTKLTFEEARETRTGSLVVDGKDNAAAASAHTDWLDRQQRVAGVRAIGHRVVHGGPRCSKPARIDEELLGELRRIRAYCPKHLPPEIGLIEQLRARLPDIPQVACFATAFHRDMPRVAQLLPIPRCFDAQGVRRFGFHGLSYVYLIEELERLGGIAAMGGRVILARLGNGSSLAAARHGTSMNTSMAFTPHRHRYR